MTAMTYQTASRRPNRSIESFNHDGLELARRRKHDGGLPIKQILLFALFVLAFKIFLALHMGMAAYGSKMNALAEGAGWERLAAKAMVLDPVSELIVTEMQAMLK